MEQYPALLLHLKVLLGAGMLEVLALPPWLISLNWSVGYSDWYLLSGVLQQDLVLCYVSERRVGSAKGKAEGKDTEQNLTVWLCTCFFFLTQPQLGLLRGDKLLG